MIWHEEQSIKPLKHSVSVSHCPFYFALIIIKSFNLLSSNAEKHINKKNNPEFLKLEKKKRFTSKLSLALKTFLLFLDSTFMLPSFKDSQTPELYVNPWCCTAEAYLFCIYGDSIFMIVNSETCRSK